MHFVAVLIVLMPVQRDNSNKLIVIKHRHSTDRLLHMDYRYTSTLPVPPAGSLP